MKSGSRNMVAWSISTFYLISLVSYYPVVGLAAPPRIIPALEEEIISSGVLFKLLCEADAPVEWILPSFMDHFFDYNSNLINRTYMREINVDFADDGYRYRTSLALLDPKSTDTGYYSCQYKSNRSTSAESDNIYIYVQDDANLIVHPPDEEVVVVMTTQFSRGTIPCKPTHPSVNMTLLHDDQQVYPLAHSEWSFDAKEGFTVQEITPEADGMYTCLASLLAVERQLEFYMDVQHGVNWLYDPRMGFTVVDTSVYGSWMYSCIAVKDNVTSAELIVIVDIVPDTAQAPKPFINDTLAKHRAIGDDFQLNCSASYHSGTRVDLKWSIPHPNGIDGLRIRQDRMAVNPIVVGGMNYMCSHVVLYVNKAQNQDQGDYVCRSYDHTGKNDSDSVFVRIHEEGAAYVNLSGPSLTMLELNAGESVTWVIEIDAYPEPRITWSKDGNENVIKMQSKYQVESDRKKTVLHIKDLELRDTGIYQVEVVAKDQIRTLNYSLKVADKPSMELDSENVVRNVKEEFAIKCRTLTCRSGSNKVLFRQCLPGQECARQWIDVAGVSSGGNKHFIERSSNGLMETLTIRGRAHVSGEYKCTACTGLSTTARMHVTDVDNGFELSPNPDDHPVAGEAFSLLCGVSVYNYTTDLAWFWTSPNNVTKQIVARRPPQGISIFYPNMTYSYAESLNWSKIPRSAGGKYTCQSTSLDGITSNKTVSFVVRARRPLSIYNSSQPEIEVEEGSELFLFCHVEGLPIPLVQWLKDDVLVSDGELKSSAIGSSLNYEYAKENNAGTYRCVFKNSGESVYRTMFVTVNKDVNEGIIAGIVIVIAIVVILIAILGRKIYKDKKRKAFFRANQLDTFNKGNPESINPDLPIDEQTELLPYDQRWEFPRDRLKLGKQLGAGAFGRVLKAEAIGIEESEPKTTVAVKMIRSHGNMLGLKALMSELKIMIHLGSHLNVVNLLGACTKNVIKGDLLVIVEYCCYGNLQNYLIRNRDRYIHQVDERGYIDTSIGAEKLDGDYIHQGYEIPRSSLGVFPNTADYNSTGIQTGATDVSFLSMSPTAGGTGPSDLVLDTNGHPILTSTTSTTSTGTVLPWRLNYRGDDNDQPSQTLCTRDLLCWSFQIARGMDYLASRKILHGDLAARNVLLAENNIVKVADFGLARDVYRSGNYKKKGDGPLPVKWMAIESILDRVFSTQSDVWSFGIVLWELFSLGKTPYPGMGADEHFFRKLQEGYRMEKPKYATNHIDEIMRMCWLTDPNQRPEFGQLEEKLGAQLEASVRRHYMDLNDPYVQSNTNRTHESPDYLSMMGTVDYANVGSHAPDQSNDYVNAPHTVDVNDSKEDYLEMDVNRDSQLTGQGSDYLLMTSPRSGGASSTEGSSKFNFDCNSAKSHKGQEEEAVDSVELHPMLNSAAQAFSNPHYQSYRGLKLSDLDDPLTPTEPSIPPSTSTPQYVNMAAPVDNDKAHYVVPKNNSSVV